MTYIQKIQAKELAAKFRAALEASEVPALVRAMRDSVGVAITSKRNHRFDEVEQRSIIQIATLMGLHHCAPEFGAWPVKVDDRGHFEHNSFWSN